MLKNFMKHLILYPVYMNLAYWWNFGVLAFVCFAFQVLTGMFLAMFYTANADLAFLSVENIMRNINYGWMIRYLHANGASFSSLCVYIHLLRNVFYNSYQYPRHWVWISGVIILMTMIATAFLGYVLPWGQMSFWAATVMTSLFSALPMFGTEIVIWLWGGYSVDAATLVRFFSFHYLLPFLLLFIIMIHVLILHINGSTNPVGITMNEDKIYFHPYYTWKDIFGICMFLIMFSWLLVYMPNVLGHTDNYMAANSLVTPAHIVPEWYFLPFYAMLRSIPDKVLGILLLIAVLLMLLILPFLSIQKLKTAVFSPFHFFIFIFFLLMLNHLGWLGGAAIEYPYLQLSQFYTICFFVYMTFVQVLFQYLDFNSIYNINMMKKSM